MRSDLDPGQLDPDPHPANNGSSAEGSSLRCTIFILIIVSLKYFNQNNVYRVFICGTTAKR